MKNYLPLYTLDEVFPGGGAQIYYTLRRDQIDLKKIGS